MSDHLTPGAGLLFMKVGTHAQEELASIIARKNEEIRRAGFGMWGYGGNTCHPVTMVQPFAKAFSERGQSILLCMEEMESNHWAQPLCAAQYSADGVTWRDIPDDIQVRGSRYALVIEDLREERFQLPLNQTRVPVGRSAGRLGSRYIRGRVDKACLELLEAPELTNEEGARVIDIGLTARLRKPFAVFLRGHRPE